MNIQNASRKLLLCIVISSFLNFVCSAPERSSRQRRPVYESVELDIKKDLTNTRDFSLFVDNSRNVVTYEPKTNKLFDPVKFGNRLIWNPRQGEDRSSKVVVQKVGDTRIVSVHLLDDTKKVFSVSDRATAAPRGLVLFSLDLEKKDPTDQFDCLYNGRTKVRTYTAKSGYKFKDVLKSGRVLLEPAGSKGLDKVEVDLSQYGKLKLKTYTGTTSLSSTVDDPNPPAPEYVVVDLDKRVGNHMLRFTTNSNSTVDTYSAYAGYKVGRVVKGNKDVWVPNHHPGVDKLDVDTGEYGKLKLRLTTGTRATHVEVNPTPTERIEVDLELTLRSSTDRVECYTDPATNVHVFTAKLGYKFRKILKDTRLALSHHEDFDKVYLFPSPTGQLKLQVVFYDGSSDTRTVADPNPPEGYKPESTTDTTQAVQPTQQDTSSPKGAEDKPQESRSASSGGAKFNIKIYTIVSIVAAVVLLVIFIAVKLLWKR